MALSKSAASAIGRYGRVLAKALDERDCVTRRHCDRVIELSGRLGRQCGLAEIELRRVCLCGLLHDIGKIGIPDRVLLKPGVLDAEEWTEMRSHPERGERIVAAIGIDGVEEIALGVRHHHEHYDGSGYPDRLAGEDIPLQARIVAIADGYDAMAMPRPYHGGRDHARIMATMHAETGRKYDPYLFACFEKLIDANAVPAA